MLASSYSHFALSSTASLISGSFILTPTCFSLVQAAIHLFYLHPQYYTPSYFSKFGSLGPS
jgi:hypothetical protein